MTKYVIIDTNILVSALITRNEFSPTVKIINFLANNAIIPVYSEEIISEYIEVLRRPKFKLSEETISKIISEIKTHGIEVSKLVEITEEMPDPKDIVFYAVTLTVIDKEPILITGNNKTFSYKAFYYDT